MLAVLSTKVKLIDILFYFLPKNSLRYKHRQWQHIQKPVDLMCVLPLAVVLLTLFLQ